MVRNLDDPRAVALASLPGVTVVTGDFDDADSIASVLAGVSRCLLVSNAFAYEQFERETLFIEAANKAKLELILRVSTCSFLIKPGTKGAYGRCHHGIEAFVEVGGYPVVSMNPNWFFTNFLGNAQEAKTTGKISLPCSGNGPKDMCFIDPRDVGDAATTILTLPSDELKPFLAKKKIEVHGPSPCNYAEKVATLSKAVGYPIEIQEVPREAYISTLMSFGIPRVFASSYTETIEQIDGIVPPGYEGYGPDGGRPKWAKKEISPELAKYWKPKYTVDDWASSDATLAAFAKE
jgi:NAD(P)H dehydrogenase (quinone)